MVRSRRGQYSVCVIAMAYIIHVVDDDPHFRAAISRLLQASGYEVKVYEAAEQVLLGSLDDRVSCVLLDLRMPGLSGTELQAHLREQNPIIPIIFLTGQGDIAASVRAMKAGAEDFLTKPVDSAELLGAIERALSRYKSAHASAAKLAAAKALLATLTPREKEVFAQVVRGKMNKQIAHFLGAAERTIKAHRHMIMEKLQVQSWAEAVLIAERVGYIEETDTAVPKQGTTAVAD
jgi:FixJ family two-component response regulator